MLTSGLGAKLDELRRGRGRVIESGQVIILGWSPQVFTVVSELCEVGHNHPGAIIVVLADKDTPLLGPEFALWVA